MFVVMQNTQGGSDEGAMNQRMQMVIDGLEERLPKQRGIVAVAPKYSVPFNGVSGAPVSESHFALEGQGISDGMKSPVIDGFDASPD